jgi:GNAT superfamily N-acetyltransferase
MNPIKTRQAVLADIDALAQLFDAYRQFYGKTSDTDAAKAFLLERFNHGESILFLAFENDKPIGFTQLYPSFSSVSMARVYVLNDLYVDSQARGKGVGKKLLTAATEYAKSFGAVRVTLSTDVANKTAQSVYESAGWKRDSEYFVYHFSMLK